MGIQVNPNLVGGKDIPEALPEGVFSPAEYPVGKPLPTGWTELFRTDQLIFGIKTSLDPGVVFRLMRSIRKGGNVELAMTEMMYEILGDAAMDALADLKLTDEEFDAVIKAVNKHAGGAFKRVLGN